MGSKRKDTTGGKIAIIAGGGVLPCEILDELRKAGNQPLVIGIDGETDAIPEADLSVTLTFGQFGKLFSLLEREGVDRLVMAGSIRKRPEFSRLRLDLVTLKELPRLVRIVMGGDNSVIEKVSAFFASKGFEVIGVHEAAPGLLAGSGLIAGFRPSRMARLNMVEAIRAARLVGALDAGQGAVAEKGRAVALEGVEGTDGMLDRVAELRAEGRLPLRSKEGVLAKAMKPGQDMRADLPAIGPETVRAAARAGLAGIAIHAGHSVILQRRETLEAVRSAGMFLHGFELAEGMGEEA